MPLGDILKLGVLDLDGQPIRPFTAQEIADFALQADQQRRQSLAVGDHGAAFWAAVERDRLCRAMPR